MLSESVAAPILWGFAGVYDYPYATKVVMIYIRNSQACMFASSFCGRATKSCYIIKCYKTHWLFLSLEIAELPLPLWPSYL